MIVIMLGKWNHYAARYLLYSRIYIKGFYTPFCKVSIRHRKKGFFRARHLQNRNFIVPESFSCLRVNEKTMLCMGDKDENEFIKRQCKLCCFYENPEMVWNDNKRGN